jgi:two-component system OmpR family sensor kinase
LGRLFWKFIFAFWLAFAAISLTIGAALWVLHQTHSESLSWVEPRHGLRDPDVAMLDMMAVALSHGSVDTFHAAVDVWHRSHGDLRLWVVDEHGVNLQGYPTPAGGLPNRDTLVRTTRARDGHVYSIYMEHGRPPSFFSSVRFLPPLQLLPIFSALLLSLGFSAWLARYLAKPVRLLREAFKALADGNLNTRVQPLIGKRRDEVADLVRDFDRMAQQLQKQMGAQQRLLHDVSHELRSPLARLQAAIGLARLNPGRMDVTLARVEHESARLETLVSEVLTLARLEAGMQGAAMEQVDLVELLTMIVDDAQFEAQALGRDVALSGEGEFVLECQAELLYRSFENVIRNAVKYTAEHTTVNVSFSVEPQRLSVLVTDQGAGVPEAALEHLFDPFYRVDQHGTTQGVGLGLAIARRAVESHGGNIMAELCPGGGLAVRILIYRHLAESSVLDVA